jgi:O-antigen/teichoic acid export membrane protein
MSREGLPVEKRGKVIPSSSAYIEMFFARCLALAGPFGVAVVTARILGPEDRGRYYYVLTLATVVSQIASLGIHSSNSYLVAQRPALLWQIMTNTAWVTLVGGLVAACGVIAFDFAVGEAVHRYVFAAVVMTLGPCTLLFMFLTNLAVAINRSRLFNALVVFASVTSFVAVLAAAFVVPTLNAFLFAAVAASALTCAVAWWSIAKRHFVPWRFDWELLAQGFAFALRAHIAIVIGFLMARMSVVFLRYNETFADLGYWSIAAQIVDALLLLPATVGMLLFPTLARANERDRWSAFMAMLPRIAAVMGIVCLLAGMLADLLIKLVFGVSYAPAAEIVLALLPGVFFLSITSVVSQFLTASGIPWTQVLGWIVGWAVQTALSLVLVKSYGALGLAWAQSASAGLVCCWLAVQALTYSPQRLQRH